MGRSSVLCYSVPKRHPHPTLGHHGHRTEGCNSFARTGPTAGSHHAAFTALTCEYIIYILFQGIAGYSGEEMASFSAVRATRAKQGGIVWIPFNAYKLNPHQAKSNNLAMKTWSLPFYLK